MEELSNFQFIWKEWIEPLVHNLYEQLDGEFQEYCIVKIRDLDEICIKAEKYYQNKRKEVKKAFYGKYQKGDSATEHRMDFHKIGAILCRTLIEYKVYEIDANRCKEYIDQHISKYNTNWVVKNALINFRLAFYASVVFLYQSMVFEYSKGNPKFINDEFFKDLCEIRQLNLYENLESQNMKLQEQNQNQVQESFENCIVLDLAKRDIGNRSFDYFMYAIILYQLEQHNRSSLVHKTSEEANSDNH